MTDILEIVVPGIPPSVNHYVKHRRNGHRYVTDEAKSFKGLIAHFVAGRVVSGPKYGVEIEVLLGRKQKGDLDNFAKVLMDGLMEGGAFESDAAVTEIHMFKGRDWEQPRTRVKIWSKPE